MRLAAATLALLLFAARVSHAQHDATWTTFGGMTSNQATPAGMAPLNLQGYAIGIAWSARLNRWAVVEFGAGVTEKGGRWSDGFSTQQLRLKYLETPLSLRIGGRGDPGKVWPFARLGIASSTETSCALSNNFVFIDDTTVRTSIVDGNFVPGPSPCEGTWRRRWDFGPVFGLGFGVGHGANRATMEWRHTGGQPLGDGPLGNNMRNRTNAIIVGYVWSAQ